jgi:LemA protein
VTILIIVLAALILTIFWVGLTYNRLVSLRLAAENSWAQIDVALKLRHDLIPTLAAAVAGYAGHEQETLARVAADRSLAVAADTEAPAARSAKEAQLGGSLGRMLILAEDYPELRATENFSQLQTDLADVEEKIAITRRVYNDTVETLNTKVQVFPSVLVARGFGFTAREFFQAGASAQVVPSVEIGSGSGPV